MKTNQDPKVTATIEKALTSLQSTLKFLSPVIGELGNTEFEVQAKTTKDYTAKEDYTLRTKEKETILSSNKLNVVVTEREEKFDYAITGLRLVSKESIHYVETPEMEIFLVDSQVFTGPIGEQLTELNKSSSIHINFLN